MNILAFAPGLQPFFFAELLKKDDMKNKWHIVMPSNNHEFVFNEFPYVDTTVIENQKINLNTNDFDCDVIESVNRLIDIEKFGIKMANASGQNHLIKNVCSLLNNLIDNTKPDILLFAQPVENFYGALLASICKQKGVYIACPIHTRLFKKTIFTNDFTERRIDLDKNTTPKSFVNKQLNMNNLYESCLFDTGDEIEWKSKHKKISLYQKLYNLVSSNPRYGFNELRISLLNTFTLIRNIIWYLTKKRNSKIYDIDNINDLPNNFIYYPLQYTPESSINVPAPYYIDQIRVVDLLRYSIPNNYTLVVKEHPAALSVRKRNFYKILGKKSSVIIIKSTIDSLEIIKRARCVCSVSGSAALESALLGVKSFTLSETFFSGVVPIIDNQESIREFINTDVDTSLLNHRIEKLSAIIQKEGGNFVGITPGNSPEIMMTQTNINNFYTSFIKYVRRKNEKYNS